MVMTEGYVAVLDSGRLLIVIAVYYTVIASVLNWCLNAKHLMTKIGAWTLVV
jgi:hypothetical protein